MPSSGTPSCLSCNNQWLAKKDKHSTTWKGVRETGSANSGCSNPIGLPDGRYVINSETEGRPSYIW